MSRTIRRKGWHVTTSSKWPDQKNNPFAYIKKRKSKDKARNKAYIERDIAENLEEPWRLEALMKERHRDSFWKTLSLKKYTHPIPRLFNKMEIKNSLRTGADYNWNEKTARRYMKGIAMMRF